MNSPKHPNELVLVELNDDDFAALLHGQSCVRDGLVQPPGGVDTPDVLGHVRRLAAGLRAQGFAGGHWMMTVNGEVVGLCGFKAPPSGLGEVEIGYGVAASRRRRGHATAAIGAIVAQASRHPTVRAVVALTTSDNLGSQRALERNGFMRCGTQTGVPGEELLVWKRRL